MPAYDLQAAEDLNRMQQEEMTDKAGKVSMGNFRWTVVFENEVGKWLIVHEHVSAPLQ